MSIWIPKWVLWAVGIIVGTPCALFALVFLIAGLSYDPEKAKALPPMPGDPRPPTPGPTQAARED